MSVSFPVFSLSPVLVPSSIPCALFTKNKFKNERLLPKQTRNNIKGKMTAALAYALLGSQIKIHTRIQESLTLTTLPIIIQASNLLSGASG